MSHSNDEHKYDDILHLPHHVSSKHARMSMTDRGAQFSPFAALTGLDAAMEETARLTDRRIELDESRKEQLNEKIQMLLEVLDRQPEVTISYFEPDERKAGGAYVRVTGRVRKIDSYSRAILLENGTVVPIEEITELDSPWLKEA